MNKKEKLISSLKIVIEGLSTDTVKYDWNYSASCNCGLVAQAILGCTRAELQNRASQENVFDKEELKRVLGISGDADNVEASWRNAVKAYCPLTGLPLKRIFQDLEAAGLSKYDIAHLEYMNNPAILAKAKLATTREASKDVFDRTEVVPHKNALLRFFGATMEVTVYKKEAYIAPDNRYHRNQDNLIKYLTAWVAILEESMPTTGESIEELHEQKLVAEANENYELAATLRDKISFAKISAI